MQVIPAPIASLNIGNIENLAVSYKKCVEDTIKFIRKQSRNGFTFKSDNADDRYIPLTPGPDQSPSGAYSIAITDGVETLTLVAEKHQTWFQGIVTDDGERYEIDEKLPKMMFGSESLHTTASYHDLLNGKTVDQCRIGYYPLIQAFHDLVGRPRSQKDRKVAIAVILVMLFEAPRFPAVYKKCLELIREMADDLVGEKLQLLINNWCTKSRKFYIANGEEKTVHLTAGSCEEIKEVAQDFSILCRSQWDLWLTENGKKDKPAAYESEVDVRNNTSGASSSSK